MLEVTIVGAGIAGLAASLGLRRAGHKVTIYERSMIKDEVGAAITMTPNAQTVLNQWESDPADAGGNDMAKIRQLDPETLDCMVLCEFGDLRQTYGHDQIAYHRVDLHSRLRIMAQEVGVLIKLGCGIRNLDCENGNLETVGGEVVRSDLVVVADGNKSHFVKQIVGHGIPYRSTPFSVYRTLIPMAKIQADPEAWQIFEDHHLGGYCITSCPETSVNWMTYPCRNTTIMNIAVFHKTREHHTDAQDWNAAASVDDLLYLLRQGFHPAWSALVKLADSVKLFNVNVRDSLPHYSRGKAVLIGDAAHAMLPTHGLGGSMGIEDAGALQVLFSDMDCDVAKENAVEQRLALFDQVRLPRNAVTQLLSNATFYRAASDDVINRVREYYKGPLPSVDPAMGWPEEVREFWFAYEAFAETKKALPYLGKGGGIPDGVIQHFGRASV